MRFRGVLIQRSKLLDPIEHGRGIDGDAAFGEPLDDIGLAEPKTQIPTHGQTDDRCRKRMTRERSAGEGGERAATVGTAVDLCTASITTILENILILTIRTQTG